MVKIFPWLHAGWRGITFWLLKSSATKNLGYGHVRRIARAAGGSDGATPAVVARMLRRQSVWGNLMCGQTQGGVCTLGDGAPPGVLVAKVRAWRAV